MTLNRTRRLVAGLFLFCAISLFAPQASLAALITVPTDLNVADKYRLAFVTSTTRNASSPVIADYNAFVTAVANGVPELAALGTSWTAIASTSAVDARDNTDTNPTVAAGVPIYRLDDTRVVDDNADLWDGNLDNALMINETGSVTTDFVWTGTEPTGVEVFNFAGLGEIEPWLGYSSSTFGSWVFAVEIIESLPYHLYALSAEMTVVPEPGTMVLVCIGGVTAAVGSQLRRRRHPKKL